MQRNMRAEVQLFLVLVIATTSMVGLSLLLGRTMPLLAQGPVTSTPPKMVITQDDLAAFGLNPNELEAAAITPFDLGVAKTTNVVSVTAGSLVTFTVTISNHGPGSAIGVVMQDLTPEQMINVNYTFAPATTVISNGAATVSDLKWYFYDPIPSGQFTVVTVTGQLTAAFNITVTNTANVATVNPSYESGPVQNFASAQVPIAGYASSSGRIIYLPLMQKMPTPTPSPLAEIYSQSFNSGTPWYENLGSTCRADHISGIYQVDVDGTNRECLPPAKDSPGVTYGAWEVEGYISGEWKDDGHAYGLWFNGAGGDTQYVFRVFPNVNNCSNGGKWELLRRKPSANTVLAVNNCDSRIKRDYGSGVLQRLRAWHKSDGSNGLLELYVDGTLIATVTDTNQITTGSAAGVYTRVGDGTLARIKFDNFKIFR